MTNGNGWTGRDPWLRKLRSVVVLVLAGLVCYAVIFGRDVATIGTIIGALLVVLGFEAGLRWPTKGDK